MEGFIFEIFDIDAMSPDIFKKAGYPLNLVFLKTKQTKFAILGRKYLLSLINILGRKYLLSLINIFGRKPLLSLINIFVRKPLLS